MLGRNEIMVIKSEVQKNLFFYFTPVLIKNFIVCFFCRRCIYTAYIVNILNRESLHTYSWCTFLVLQDRLIDWLQKPVTTNQLAISTIYIYYT